MSGAGAVIVTYNSAAVIGECLDALGNLPAVVVDNASADDTLARAAGRPNVMLVANPENRGFAAAVNQGIAALDCELILILNPDARLLGGLEPLAEACRHWGIAAGRLVDAGGRTQKGFTIRRFPTPLTLWAEVLGINRLWPSNPVNRRYRYLDRDLQQAGEVEQPAGAFLMVRKDVWKQAGGFDEAFHPVWFEDVDFCLRARRLGYTARFHPGATAQHAGGNSVRQLDGSRRAIYWYASLLMYAFKHFRPGRARGVALAVLIGAAPRAVAGVVLERKSKPLEVYWKVARIALQYLTQGRPPAGGQ